MTRGPESRLVERIKTALHRQLGAEVFIIKIHGGPFQQAGLPDLLVLYAGRVVALEVKHPDTDHGLTELQRATLDRMSRAGAITGVVDSVDKALAVVDWAKMWQAPDATLND